MRTFTVDVITQVEVTLDETKFTPEFCKEYNESITYRGGEDGDADDLEFALRSHAEHLAWVHGSGLQDLGWSSPKFAPFVEGYGPVPEMGIKARTVDTETDIVGSAS